METVGDMLENLTTGQKNQARQDKIEAAIVERRMGDNKAPLIEILRDEMELENEPLLRRKDELLAAAGRMPAAVNDDEAAGKFSDMVKLIAAAVKASEAGRVAKKEPFLEGGRTVDGFYKKQITDPLLKAKASIEDRLGNYLRRKAAAEKAIRDQAERAARETAQKAAEEAAKAEVAMRNAADLDTAIAAQARADDAATAAASAAKVAAEKPAAMARTRGEMSLGTLASVWTFRDLDRDTINLDALRAHLPTAAIEQALRSAIKAGLREIRGAIVYESFPTRVL